MADYRITSGDALSQAFELQRDGATFAIASSSTVKAAIVNAIDQSVVYVAETAVLEATTGSDWANSKIIVEFTSVQMDALTPVAPVDVLLEVEVETTAGVEETFWSDRIEVMRGSIS